MTTNKIRTTLIKLENTLGISFVEQMYEDFINTDAIGYFTHHTSLLQGAYDALATTPDWAMEVEMAGEVYLPMADKYITE